MRKIIKRKEKQVGGRAAPQRPLWASPNLFCEGPFLLPSAPEITISSNKFVFQTGKKAIYKDGGFRGRSTILLHGDET